MLVIAGCVALVALGIALVVQRGGGAREHEPEMEWPRYVAVSLGAGLAAGLLAAGAGGRLMMRLLGATSPDVHGLPTEAGETIGEITVGGTLAFLLARGVALGALLLVLFATRIDPLRADSVDFLLLEPAWLAVLGFSVLAPFQGMLVAALAPPPKPVARARILIAGRIALAVVLIAALPGFVGATADILSGA